LPIRKFTDLEPVDVEFRQFDDRVVGLQASPGLGPEALREGKIANGRLTFDIPGGGLFDLTDSPRPSLL